MSKFVRVKYANRFTQGDGNSLWLNLDNVISVDENNCGVQCVGQETNFYVIDKESVSALIKAWKGYAETDEEAERETIYEILMDVYANHRIGCEGSCISCDYVDRARCGKLVDAMAKRLYDAGYRTTEKGGVSE